MYRWIALGAVGVIAGALTLGVLTGALSPPGLGLNTAHAQAERGPGPHLGPFAEGPRWGIVQAVADLLGMTPREILAERRAGRSLAEIAAARGVDQATLLQTIIAAARARLDQAVADGRLTRGQADALLNVVQQFAPDQITRAAGPRVGARAFRRPPGRAGAGPRALLRPVADLLGMTPQQILAERRAGRSLAEIAAARGVDQATLVQTLTSTLKTRLDRAVAAGRLTQERADALLQQAQQRIAEQVTRAEAPGPPPRPRAGEQRGPRRGPRAGE